jgi:hypothetical protein
LGDELMRTVTNAANNAIGVGRSDTAYRGEIAWERIEPTTTESTSTPARAPVEKASRAPMASPDSKWFLYLKNKQVIAHNLETGRR